MVRETLPNGEEVLQVYSAASITLDKNREGRVDPLTAGSHSDHFAHELLGYVKADVARDRIDDAKAMVDFWLENIAEDGRVPHMIVDSTSFRRLYFDRHVVAAEENDNGELITPLAAMPIISLSALAVANALPANESRGWTRRILPKIQEIKEWQYRERAGSDGLIIQLHPDETFFRHGEVNKHILDNLEIDKRFKFTRFAESTPAKFMKNPIRTFRQIKGGGKVAGFGGPTYDANQYMSTDTAARTWDVLHNAFGDFRSQDLAANALMVADNEALEELYEIIGEKPPGHLLSCFATTGYNFQEFWDQEEEKFATRLPDTGELLTEQTGVEAYIALLGRTAMNEVQVDAVLESLDIATTLTEFPLATGKNSGKVQSGAMSPMINGLVFSALDPTSERESMLRLRISNSLIDSWNKSSNYKKPKKSFAEAADSHTGEPLGAEHWGPSAAAAVAVSKELIKPKNES